MAGGTLIQGRNYVVTKASAIDLTNTGGTGLCANLTIPATGAEIVEATIIGSTAGGVTTSGTHQVELMNTAGVAITDTVTFAGGLADDAVGGILTGNQVAAGDKGEEILFNWTEAGTVTNGAIVDVEVVWAL